ncbi:MAG TPA: LEA type 2 family protein [Thermoanaerobaculia bacterium]|nr:LEA type 2 family protein [Thermoanaerobaculia bacterium]
MDIPGILRHRAFASAALLIAFLGTCLGLSGCSTLGLASFARPDVRLMGLDVGSVGLDSAELLFDFQVDNPNARSLVLDGVAYRLNLEGARLLDGRRSERTEIAASGESRVTLPVTVRYDDVARALRSLRREDHPSYELNADFEFAAPLIGNVVVPVTQRGRVPLDRLAGWLGRILGG